MGGAVVGYAVPVLNPASWPGPVRFSLLLRLPMRSYESSVRNEVGARCRSRSQRRPVVSSTRGSRTRQEDVPSRGELRWRPDDHQGRSRCHCGGRGRHSRPRRAARARPARPGSAGWFLVEPSTSANGSGAGVSRQPCKPRVDQDRLSVITTRPERTICEARHEYRRS